MTAPSFPATGPCRTRPAGTHSPPRTGRVSNTAAGSIAKDALPAGRWFGARLARPRPGAYALVGCTVAPGFDFADFEIARRDDLLAAFPQHDAIITAMTRPADGHH